jgi:hypothetical protein
MICNLIKFKIIKISSGSRLKVRLVEDKRLDVLYENCKKIYFPN